MSDLPGEVDPATLARYLSGECDPAEAESIRRWIEADPERGRRIAALRSAWTEAEAAGPAWNLDAMWTRISAGMDQPAERPPLSVVSRTRKRRPRLDRFRRQGSFWHPVAVAAGLALAVGSSVMLVRPGRDPAPEAPSDMPMRDVKTRRGERAVFNLADGSRVMLGAESRLRIPATYNTVAGGGRRLLLEGEAYFEVRHDSTRPFLVQTPTGVAEDLGTEFVVTAYPETQGMRVVVQSGTVALRAPPRPEAGRAGLVDTTPLLTLAAGDLARLDSSGVATLTRGADIRRYLAWTEGALLFDGTRLDDALPQLARWYDLEIRLADPALAALQLTATFRNEPAPQMLRLLALALDLKVEQSGRNVTLSSKERPRRSS